MSFQTGPRAHEMAGLERDLLDQENKLSFATKRVHNLKAALNQAEVLGVTMKAIYPQNHHLITNQRMLWLVMIDDHREAMDEVTTAMTAIAALKAEIALF